MARVAQSRGEYPGRIRARRRWCGAPVRGPTSPGCASMAPWMSGAGQTSSGGGAEPARPCLRRVAVPALTTVAHCSASAPMPKGRRPPAGSGSGARSHRVQSRPRPPRLRVPPRECAECTNRVALAPDAQSRGGAEGQQGDHGWSGGDAREAQPSTAKGAGSERVRACEDRRTASHPAGDGGRMATPSSRGTAGCAVSRAGEGGRARGPGRGRKRAGRLVR